MENINTQKFWDLVANIKWRKFCNKCGNDYNKVRKDIQKKYDLTNDEMENFRYMSYMYTKVLLDSVRFYFLCNKKGINYYEEKNGMYLSDDHLWYLCSYIVGLGVYEYFKALHNPKRIFRYKEFKEGFSYIF